MDREDLNIRLAKRFSDFSFLCGEVPYISEGCVKQAFEDWVSTKPKHKSYLHGVSQYSIKNSKAETTCFGETMSNLQRQ